MRHSMQVRSTVVASIFSLASSGLQAGPLGNAITYQGSLSLNGTPVDNSADFEVTLFDAETGGLPIGSVVFVEDVDVVNGLFTTTLDFGLLAFNGDARWMSIAVRVPHDPTNTAAYTTLTPRQAVTAAPYALFSLDGTGGDSIWTLSGTDAYYSGGNVGIGTSTPIEDLEVHSETSTFDTNLLLHNKTNVAGESTGIAFSLINQSYSEPHGALVFARNSTSNSTGNFHFLSDLALDGLTLDDSVMEIKNDGLVAIGTTAPDSRLNVVEIGDTDTAIHAEHTATTGVQYGVYASSTSTSGYGLYATATPTSGTTYGVYGHTGSPNGWGVYANGRVGATGTKSFVIDHPQRPTEEFLLHYCAEGPEPQTVYNGTIKLGADGSAWVKLPDYFEALNADFRYQLTAIGGAAPNLHVAEVVSDNQFKIAGGSSGLKVSWQVTARRNDAFVKQYGAPVEIQKNENERGKYLMPELYGQPAEMGIHFRAAFEPSAEHSEQSPDR